MVADYEFEIEFSMQPSDTSTEVNSISSNYLEEGYTNITISFDLTLSNLMEAGSYIET